MHDPPLPQSLLRSHWTHILLLQIGVEPLQSLLLMHDPPPPGMPPVQVFVVRLQVPPLQSRSLKHWMHAPSPEQSGFCALVHWLATAHSTHCPPALQIFFVGSVQSAPLLHSAHKPWVVLQIGVVPLHPEFAVQLLVH